MFLVVLVVNDPFHCKGLLPKWKEAGAPGATIIESLGMQSALKGVRDNVPLLPNLGDVENIRESHNRTMFTVVPDQATVDRIAEVTQKVIGSFDDPETGFMFVTSVGQVFGLMQNG